MNFDWMNKELLVYISFSKVIGYKKSQCFFDVWSCILRSIIFDINSKWNCFWLRFLLSFIYKWFNRVSWNYLIFRHLKGLFLMLCSQPQGIGWVEFFDVILLFSLLISRRLKINIFHWKILFFNIFNKTFANSFP